MRRLNESTILCFPSIPASSREDFPFPLEIGANSLAMDRHVPAPRIPLCSFNQLAGQEIAISAQQPR
jgi:hypothetical protein